MLALFAASICTAAVAQERSAYGKNLIAVAPVSVTDQGVGFGLSYERSLDDRGMFSFYLPFAYSFRVEDDYYYWNQTYATRTEYMVYAYPGVKIYPTGAFGKVRYGIGPSLVIGLGQQYDDGQYVVQPYPGVAPPVYADRFVLGAIVNNSLNINPTEHLYLGLELGLGVTYMNTWDGFSKGADPLAQAAFRIGYRF